jgi:hypothetical protein
VITPVSSWSGIEPAGAGLGLDGADTVRVVGTFVPTRLGIHSFNAEGDRPRGMFYVQLENRREQARFESIFGAHMRNFFVQVG